MVFGESVEQQFIEKIPYEIPPLKKIQPTKDFSFHYKVGEFSEEVEGIMYTNTKDNAGREQGQERVIYTNKILEVKANGDYLLSTSWDGKEKSDCENPNLNESWFDKNSNFLTKKKSIYKCNEYIAKANDEFKNPIYKYNDLILDNPFISEVIDEKQIAKLEIRFIGVTNYKNREVALIQNHIEAIMDQCLPDNFLFGKNYKCSGESNELIYLDLKSKVPLLRKMFYKVRIEKKDNSFLMLDLFDIFPVTNQSQSIHTYTYPPGYLQ